MKSRSDLTPAEVNDIINHSLVCHIAMVDINGMPYVLPFNFGFQNDRLFIHSGPEGKKIGIWKSNPSVCVEFSTDYQMHHQNESVACSYSMRYRSVLVHGMVKEIEDIDKKREVLEIFMLKYTSKQNFKYSAPALANVKVFEILPEKIEARAYGY